jgi:hypothetical protein
MFSEEVFFFFFLFVVEKTSNMRVFFSFHFLNKVLLFLTVEKGDPSSIAVCEFLIGNDEMSRSHSRADKKDSNCKQRSRTVACMVFCLTLLQ